MKRAFAFLLVLVAAACQKSVPSAGAPAALPAGVSVDTGQQMLPLSAFSLGISHALPVRNVPHVVPQVPAVKAFVVNEPGTSRDALKLYWVRDLDLIFSENQAPVQATVTANGQAFEVAPPQLTEKGGYLMLVIGSGDGGPRRYYAVGRKS